MSKKTDKPKKPIYLKRLRNYKPEAVDGLVRSMKYIDIQRAAIIRGMDFNEVVEGDFSRLQVWLKKNWENEFDLKQLDLFDTWREAIMKGHGRDEPFIRLGFVAERDDLTGEITKRKKIRNLKKPKFKRERNKSLGNIFKGTKKELTFQCEEQGKSLDETIRIVTEKFPEAVEKSIRIWYKKHKRSKNV